MQWHAALLCHVLATGHNIVMELLGPSPLALLRRQPARPFLRSAALCVDVSP
jgi:hypothetical protein